MVPKPLTGDGKKDNMSILSKYGYRLIVYLILVSLLSGCSSLTYYNQAVQGQLSLLLARQSIHQLVSDATVDDEVRRQLQLISELRVFAEETLGMEVGDAYATYVDTQRDYVVWNVFAAATYSVDPELFCFPIAGCVSYKGYFAEADARAEAGRLGAAGFDVYVGGVAAYSTLGWFDDPVLNTFLRRDDVRLAGLIFHELAHRQVYVADDVVFNESFATVVERMALRRWLTEQQQLQGYEGYRMNTERAAAFAQLVTSLRDELGEVYTSTQDESRLRVLKQQKFIQFRQQYDELVKGWGGNDPYRGWVAGDLNNAKIATITTYNELVPSLQTMAEGEDSLVEFINLSHELAAMNFSERRKKLGVEPNL